MSSVTPSANMHHTDLAIAYNFLFCVIILLCTFAMLAVLRPYLPIYSANMVNKLKRRQYLDKVHNGRFSWISTTLRLSSRTFLAIAGLDGYVFIQVLKLATIISGVLAFFIAPILIFVYLTATPLSPNPNNTIESTEWYWRISIGNIPPYSGRLWVTFGASVLITIIIVINVWTFYRRFITLRQAFLISPSAFVSASHVHLRATQLGSVSNVMQQFEFAHRSILLEGISNIYCRSDVKRLLEKDIGAIESIILVKSRSRLSEELDRRNNLLISLEEAYIKFYLNIKKELKITKDTLQNASLDSTQLSIEEKLALIKILGDQNFFTSCRPLVSFWSFNKPREDAIYYYSHKLVASELAINKAILIYCSDEIAEYPDVYRKKPEPDLEESLLRCPRKIDLSLAKVQDIFISLGDLRLTLWGSSYSAVITFANIKSASMATQGLLSDRPFSFIASKAPYVQDLIWDKLYLPKADRFIRELLSNLIYIILNLFFSVLVGFLTSIAHLEFLEKFFPLLKLIFTKSPWIRSTINGILAPLIYNLVLTIMPYILYWLVYFEGAMSSSAAHQSVMNKYFWLLFLQTFVATFTGSVLLIIIDVLSGKHKDLLAMFQSRLISQSAFFINVILQRASIGLSINLLQIIELIQLAFQKIFGLTWTPRRMHQADSPVVMSLGLYYPDAILMVFLLIAAFVTVVPLFAFVGVLYFALAYFTYRSLLLFSYYVPHETGGIYWEKISVILLFGCLLNHGMTSLELIARGGRIQVVLLGAISIFVLYIILLVKKVYKRRMELKPITSEFSAQVASNLEDVQTTKSLLLFGNMDPFTELDTTLPTSDSASISERVSIEHTNYFEADKYDLIPFDSDMINSFNLNNPNLLSNLDSVKSEEEMAETTETTKNTIENPYYNPLPSNRINLLMLPTDFFPVIKYASSTLES